MTTYDKREQAFESAFVHDEELRFRAHARRDHSLGLWAAALLGKSGEDAEDYAATIVALGLEPAPNEAVKARIIADFVKHNVHQSVEQIDSTMAAMMKDAVEHIKMEP
ncbi:MAG: DUF1476 family protein [Hyphomicrobiales bacterium]|nr:DUF1476 family protein [Hyphomicrobiales bacterium]